jgi:hypothetical protein
VGLCGTPIQIEWFYYLEGEKTKLNWFLLEVALSYYEHIRDNGALTSYRKQYDEQQIAQFCAYYTRRLKKSLLNCLRGQRKSVVFYSEYVGDYYPHHDSQLNTLLHNIAMEAYDDMPFCDHCPHQCFNDYMARSPFFDEYKV